MPRVRIGPALPDRKKLDVEIARLRDLDVGDLRNRWHSVFGRLPPPHLPRHLLFRILAYRLQADRFGDLDGESKRLLDRSESPEKAGQKAVGLVRRIADVRPGTVLGREWNGRMQRVAVLADGFAWNGKTYPSLSKVAFAITGTRWNGPRFFGLRDQASKRRLGMKTRIGKGGSLRDLYPRLDRPGARAGLSTRSTPSMTPRKPISAAKPMPDGPCCEPNMTMAASRAAIPTGRPCSGSWRTYGAGKIDVIVVYKVDRLTRSLADFAKLVELFDKHNVSFVSVTQQFNTTTSMGRLTLNVLLSFAQFEREVTSERIRDKISASKRKGLWVGGMAPLGYDTKDRKITVNEAEAERVRTIFRSYLKLGSLNLLMADLRKRGIVTKVRKLKTGESIGGIPFTRGSLAQLLRNRFYIGEVAFKGEVLKGEQPAILDRALFDAVQAKLNEQVTNHKAKWMKSEALLAGRIFDDRGNRMTPSHARRGNVKYRYYLSSALLQGTAERAGSVRRVPATDVEALVIKSVREHLKPSQPIDDRSLIQHPGRAR